MVVAATLVAATLPTPSSATSFYGNMQIVENFDNGTLWLGMLVFIWMAGCYVSTVGSPCHFGPSACKCRLSHKHISNKLLYTLGCCVRLLTHWVNQAKQGVNDYRHGQSLSNADSADKISYSSSIDHFARAPGLIATGTSILLRLAVLGTISIA